MDQISTLLLHMQVQVNVCCGPGGINVEPPSQHGWCWIQYIRVLVFPSQQAIGCLHEDTMMKYQFEFGEVGDGRVRVRGGWGRGGGRVGVHYTHRVVGIETHSKV